MVNGKLSHIAPDMTTSRTALTIFQKMLVAPLAGVLLYSVYLYYVYEEQKTSRERIEQIRTAYLPVLEIAGNNVLRFDDIATSFKDAVLAGEMEWIDNTKKDKGRIEKDLAQLDGYAEIVPPAEVAPLRNAFARYYDNAYALSLAMIQGNANSDQNNRLIENVERFHGLAATAFDTLHIKLHQRFSQRIDEINHRLQRQVIIAAALGVILVIVIVGLTFIMSLSTRHALREVNLAFMGMAHDTPDFSRRLKRESNDELGELIGWFNLLADKLEANYKQIELLSITDKLTQLYNRAKIDELFNLELGKAHRYGDALTVILMDLDHFKSVNDNFGHQVGDQVLRDLAGILRRSVRNTDHLGRWGGEEFIVLLPSTNIDQGRQLAEKLRATIAAHDFAGIGHKTCSFGIAAYRADDDEDTLTKRADDCLYAAKKQGRNRVVDETALN